MNDILILGIIIGLIYSEFTDVSPGGIIVPAYFAMYAYSPMRLLGTLALAFGCMLIVRLLSRFMILYGRRRYAVFLFVGILLKWICSLAGAGSAISIGSLIPGILGRDMERQKVLPTLISLAIVTLLICLLQLAAGRFA